MIRQACVRPGYGLPMATEGLNIHVTGVSGGATWFVVTGPEDIVRDWLETCPSPAPSTWDGRDPKTCRCTYPYVILQGCD